MKVIERNWGAWKPRFKYILPVVLLLLLFAHHMNEDKYPQHLNLGEVMLVDSLNPGDFISEVRHDYRVVGYHGSGSLVQYMPLEGKIVDDTCWWYRGSESFSVRASPGRDLTILKRIDVYATGQKVNVSVDGKYAGVLEDTTSNIEDTASNRVKEHRKEHGKEHRLEYLTFVIPSEHITKDIIHLKFDYVAGRPNVNSFHYWFYVKATPWHKLSHNLVKAVYHTLLILFIAFGILWLYHRGFIGVLLFVLALTLPLLFSYYVLGGIPHIQDNIAQLFQARIFSLGQLSYEAPPNEKFFIYDFIVSDNGRWYGKYEPGHALLLLPGVLLGIPWVINPIIGALTIVVIYYIGREVYGQRVGIYAALLGIVSPFFIIQSASFFRDVPTMFFTSLAVLYYIRADYGRQTTCSALSAIFLGLAFITRTGSTIAIALPFACYLVFRTMKNKSMVRNTVLMAAIFSIFILILLLYNYALTGDVTQPPYIKYDERDTVGFGFDKGPYKMFGTWGHNLSKGLFHLKQNINELNRYLVGWPILLFVTVLFLMTKKKLWDYLFILSILSLFIANIFYWYSGICFGPRYLYGIFFMMVLLIARSIREFEVNRSNLFLAVLVLSVVSSYLFIMPQLYGFSEYWEVSKLPSSFVDESGIKNAVVFTKYYHYGNFFLRNSLALDSGVVYAKYVSKEENRRLMEEYFLNRSCYVLEVEHGGPSLTECRFS